MSLLRLVKPLSDLRQERSYADEILLAGCGGLSFLRGCITEIFGMAGSGKRAAALLLLARLTTAGEICVCIDAADGFDPATAHGAGIRLENLLWVRCSGSVEKAFLAADTAARANGFGAIWLDLSGMPGRKLRSVPATYWYRFRTAIKDTPAVFLVTSPQPVAGAASRASYEMNLQRCIWSGSGSFSLLRGLCVGIASRKFFTGSPMTAVAEFDYREV